MALGVEVSTLLILVVWGGTVQANPLVDGDPFHDLLTDPNFKPKPEKQPNATIDQVITNAYGGLSMYMSDNLLDPSGDITTELDMVLTSEQFKAMYMTDKRRKKRKATRPLAYRWTDNTIPYEFITSHFSVDEIYYIKKAMDRWQETTCLKFRPATSADRNRIRFQNGRGCNSLLGMAGGTQPINLEARGCRFSGLYLHEIGHAIGLVHEHQLPDRDQYIYIIYDNVAPSMRIWFNKYSTKDVNQYGVPFEYSSVMHYGITAFSKDGSSQTIRAKDRSKEKEIGRVYLKGLSFSDIKVVNLMYQCNKHCPADPSCKDPGYLDKNCKCVKPGEGPTTTTTVKPGSCVNSWNNDECEEWARRGECEINPTWMKVNCKKSCNTCGESVTKKPDPKKCENVYGDQKCVGWAKAGECNNNPIWMKEWCRQACGECDQHCKDDAGTETCKAWALSGYCATNLFTQQNCKKSCKACNSANDGSDGNDGNDIKDNSGSERQNEDSSGMMVMMSLPLTVLTALAVTGSYL